MRKGDHLAYQNPKCKEEFQKRREKNENTRNESQSRSQRKDPVMSGMTWGDANHSSMTMLSRKEVENSSQGTVLSIDEGAKLSVI